MVFIVIKHYYAFIVKLHINKLNVFLKEVPVLEISILSKSYIQYFMFSVNYQIIILFINRLIKQIAKIHKPQ